MLHNASILFSSFLSTSAERQPFLRLSFAPRGPQEVSQLHSAVRLTQTALSLAARGNRTRRKALLTLYGARLWLTLLYFQSQLGERIQSLIFWAAFTHASCSVSADTDSWFVNEFILFLQESPSKSRRFTRLEARLQDQLDGRPLRSNRRSAVRSTCCASERSPSQCTMCCE